MQISDAPSLQHLQDEVARLNKIIAVLIEHAEQPIQRHNSAFGLFQSTVMLEEQVRARTIELEAALRNNEAISHQLRLAASVYQHSHEAMMVTDANNHIISINPAFTRLTGYSMDEVVQRNPRFLSAGHHDVSFYHDLWQRLKQDRHWEGEITNRKKSGELYTEWLSIVAIYDTQDVLQNYVALFSDITEEKKAAEQMWSLANYDPLTKLPNRRLFVDRLEQAIRQTDRSGLSCALLFIDLDRFKEVNDTLGHQAGDTLLVQVADRITSQLRASDTVARMGGDEFTVILPEVPQLDALQHVCEQVLEVLAQPFYLAGQTVRISGSIGAALYPEDARTSAKLIHLADAAMYQSKHAGRNRVTFCQHASEIETFRM